MKDTVTLEELLRAIIVGLMDDYGLETIRRRVTGSSLDVNGLKPIHPSITGTICAASVGPSGYDQMKLHLTTSSRGQRTTYSTIITFNRPQGVVTISRGADD